MASSADTAMLETRRQTLLAEIAAITSKRSYNIDGQAVDHNAYRRHLLEELKSLNELIATSGGPWEIDS